MCNFSIRNAGEVRVPRSCPVSFFMVLVPFLSLRSVEFTG